MSPPTLFGRAMLEQQGGWSWRLQLTPSIAVMAHALGGVVSIASPDGKSHVNCCPVSAASESDAASALERHLRKLADELMEVTQ